MYLQAFEQGIASPSAPKNWAKQNKLLHFQTCSLKENGWLSHPLRQEPYTTCSRWVSHFLCEWTILRPAHVTWAKAYGITVIFGVGTQTPSIVDGITEKALTHLPPNMEIWEVPKGKSCLQQLRVYQIKITEGCLVIFFSKNIEKPSVSATPCKLRKSGWHRFVPYMRFSVCGGHVNRLGFL